MQRRNFLKNTITAAAGASMASGTALLANDLPFSPAEKFRVGLIGANSMGWSNMNAFLKVPGVECAAIADVDQAVRNRRAADAEKIQGSKPLLFNDYRKMLELKHIDAVIIGSPDHWHCLHLCDSLDAGKHAYCEKPLGRTIEECQAMLASANRHKGLLVQVGQWQRSGTHYADALAHVRGGQLGAVRMVKTWSYVGWKKPLARKPDGPVPEGVDYDLWLGPAPRKPFNPNRFHFEFRWFWDYAGGLMTDWGVHELDIAFEGMGLKNPRSVMASGGKFGYPDSDGETPDTLQAVYEFDRCNVVWEHVLGIGGGPYERPEGIAFIGNNATLVVNRQGWAVYPEAETDANGILRYRAEKLPDQNKPANVDYLQLHVRNFLDCIAKQTPDALNCGIEKAANTAINCCIGNIAQRLGRKVYWDAAAGRFANDPEADRLILANYENGWKVPKV